jgi:hypothetical protein
MYKITEYTKEQAEKLDVEVKPSERKNKKIDIYDKRDGQYITSVGQKGYKDYPTYLKEDGKEYADKRRELFYKRFGKRAEKPYTNAYYSAKLLW